jgi:hypothetical protein
MGTVKNIINRDISEYGKRKRIKIVSAIDKKYLEKTYKDMAMKGWMVENIKGIRDTYRPIEPCELDFSVTCFQPVTPLDYPDYDKEETYQEFCEDSGWTLAAKNERHFIYYKMPESKALPIYTEPMEEYRSIWNAMKKGELITFPLLILLLVFQLWMGLKNLRFDDFYRSGGLFPVTYPSLMLIVCVGYMIPLIFWLIRNRSRAKENEPLIFDSYKKVRIRNGIYNSGLTLVFIYLIYSILNMFTSYFNLTLLFVILINMLVPIGFGILLRIKIKKIKSRRSTNIILLIVGFFVAWALTVSATFTLVSHMDYERRVCEIPSGIPILRHEDFGSDLVFQPEYIENYQTIMVPLSFEYSSYHKSDEDNFNDIEVTYVQARTEWIAQIIANKAIHDEMQRMEDNMMFDEQQRNYVYSLAFKVDGMDMAYNLSRFNTQVMLVKENTLYFVKLSEPIDREVLEKIVRILFENTEKNI